MIEPIDFLNFAEWLLQEGEEEMVSLKKRMRKNLSGMLRALFLNSTVLD